MKTLLGWPAGHRQPTFITLYLNLYAVLFSIFLLDKSHDDGKKYIFTSLARASINPKGSRPKLKQNAKGLL